MNQRQKILVVCYLTSSALLTFHGYEGYDLAATIFWAVFASLFVIWLLDYLIRIIEPHVNGYASISKGMGDKSFKDLISMLDMDVAQVEPNWEKVVLLEKEFNDENWGELGAEKCLEVIRAFADANSCDEKDIVDFASKVRFHSAGAYAFDTVLASKFMGEEDFAMYLFNDTKESLGAGFPTYLMLAVFPEPNSIFRAIGQEHRSEIQRLFFKVFDTKPKLVKFVKAFVDDHPSYSFMSV